MKLDRSAIPNTADIPRLELLKPKKEVANKDLCFYIYEDNTHPIVTVDIVWQASVWHHTRHSVPHLFGKMFLRGTENKKAVEIARTLEKNGSYVTADVGQDNIHFHLKTLSRHFRESLCLFIEILNESIFPERDLSVIREQLKSEVAQQHASPNFIAQKILLKNIFGKKHAYGYTLEEKDIDQITRRNLNLFYNKKKWYKPLIVFTGDIHTQDIAFIKELLAPIIPVTHLKSPSYKLIPGRKKQKVVHPASQQSTIALGHTTILQNHPDYIDLFITNMYLGGFFGSRLMQNLRESKGYTYNIYSYLVPCVQASHWCIFTGVSKDITEEAITTIRQEIAFLQAKTPHKSDVLTLKNFLSGKLLNSFDSIFATAKQFWHARTHGLTLDYYQNLYQRVQTIRPERLKEIANLYFRIDDMHQVVVTS